MAVLCAKCGEELLGAINRCWRCGTEYESRSGAVDVPPLRRAPIPADALVEVPADGTASSTDQTPLDAILIDAPPATAGDGPTETAAARPADDVGRLAGTMRRGSPFRAEPTDDSPHPAGEPVAGQPPRAVDYPKHMGATVGPTLAITLGLIGLGLAYPIPIAGFITAGAGVALGIWGLASNRRTAAIVGLVLCCAAVALSGFFLAAELFRLIHGAAPWETPIYPAP